MNDGLHIAPDLTLPLDAVTETFAILAKRRAGKSNAAVVIAEEMYDAGLPWVAIDPKGDWWGVRAAGDGTAAGLAVLVFGGLHGDVPLEPTSGRLVADLVVSHRLTCVLDVSEMTKADQRRFLIDFADRLYRTNTEPLHLFCEEADEYIPQRVMGENAKLVGAFETLVKRGGFRGIGVTLITQRSASLNKDVLTQIETLIPMRTPSPQDRKAILAWVDFHASGAEAVNELPGLADGEAFVFSPQWLGTLVKIRFRRRRTFDSGATPKVGGKPRPPATLADVDVDSITAAMAETIEKAKADDPKLLRRRVAELERELAAERAKPVPEPVVERVEVPVLAPEIVDQLEALLEPAAALLGETQETLLKHRMWAEEQLTTRSRPQEGNQGSHGTPSSARRVTSSSSSPARGAGAGSSTHREKPSPGHQRETRPATDPGEAPSPARRKILTTLLTLESIGVAEPPKNQVALFAGVSPKSSGYSNNLGALRTAGMIDYPAGGLVAITELGRVHADEVDVPADDDQLHEQVRALLPPARWRILEHLIQVWPDALDKVALAEAIDVSPKSSGYSNNLGALRSLGLIDYPGPGLVAATELLFLGGDR